MQTLKKTTVSTIAELGVAALDREVKQLFEMGVQNDFFLIAQALIHFAVFVVYRSGLQRGVTSFAFDAREFEEDSIEFGVVSLRGAESSFEFDVIPDEFCESIA